MQITPDIIRHVATLARIRLTDAEATKFAAQMGDVMGHIDTLAAVNTDGVPETNQVTGLTLTAREDTVVDFPYKNELLAASRNLLVDNQIKVKKSI